MGRGLGGRAGVVLLGLGCAWAGRQPGVHGQVGAGAAALLPGVPVERDLAAGETHAYALALRPGARWRVLADQAGIDVALEARPPAEGAGEAVDGPLARRGPERLVLPAGAAGEWRLEVRAPAAGVGPGRYSLRLDALGASTPGEQARLQAEEALTRAGRLNRERTPEARRAALEAAAEALAAWRRAGARREEGLALDALAALHVLLGEWREADHGYAESLRVWQELGDASREAGALNERGLAAWSLGDLLSARERLERALALRERLGQRYEQAETLANLGLTYHAEGELDAALERYRRALALARERGEAAQEAKLLNNIGGVYYQQGEPDLALEHYNRGLALLERLRDHEGETELLNNIALLYRNLGEPQEALLRYSRALELALAAADARAQGLMLGNIGYAYYVLGEPQRALAFYEQALPLRRAAGDRAGEAATLKNLAAAHLELGDTARADELGRQVVARYKELGSRLGQASALTVLAGAQAASGQPDQALASLDAALTLARAAGSRSVEADALQRRGEVLAGLGRPEAAGAALAQALELRRATHEREAEAAALYWLARVERERGRPAEALARVRSAVGLIEDLRTRVGSPELRATFLGARRRAYELQVDLLMELHRAQPGAGHARAALEASEAARARTLLDLLSEAGADLAERVEPALAEKRRGLLRRLSAKAARRLQLAARRTGEAAARALDLELNGVRAELDQVEAEIRRRDPRYSALTLPARPDATRVQALLDEGTLLLEYALGERRSWLWMVSPRALEAFELAPRGEIEAAAREAYVALSTRDPQRAGDPEALARLARLVLGPVAGRLGGRRLVVVADGALHYVPFAALPEPDSGASLAPGREPRPPEGAAGPSGAEARAPLVVGHEIVSLPSVGGLEALRRESGRRPPPDRTVAVLADPVFDADDPRLGGSRARASAARGTADEAVELQSGGSAPPPPALGRLEATRREAEAILRLVPREQSLLAEGFDANRAAVLEGTLGSARYVHFATHGVLDARSPELSGLVLSRFARDGTPREGFLRLHDIYGLRLASEMVVLSGCQTALGREVRGEGLVGLTRGFMYAGVPRVAASLWRVPDRATSDLMARFYEGLLRDGLRPAAALRRAQLAIRAERRWSDPYYWAPFVLQGDWR